MEKIQKISYKELLAEKVSDFDSVFVIEPLLRGYGNTIGTVIRRTLLSSITSVAPFAIKINGVEHEFETLEGIKEDIVTLVSNIRAIRFSYKPELFEKDNLVRITFSSSKEGEVYASDITDTNGLEIVNKSQYICTISKNASLEFALFVKSGRGFVDFEENKAIILENAPKLENKIKSGQFLAIDSDFSPIKKCAYTVEELNTGSSLITEKLKIHIITDGTIDAKAALEQVAKIIVAHFRVIGNIDEIEAVKLFEDTKKEKEKIVNVSAPIEKLGLTIRSLNALRRSEYNTIEQLLQLTPDELANIKNLGKKSVDDIVSKLNKWKQNNLSEDQDNDEFSENSSETYLDDEDEDSKSLEGEK